MKKKIILSMLSLCISFTVIIHGSFALEPATHFKINQKIATSPFSGYKSLDDYLINNLSIAGGTGATFYKTGIGIGCGTKNIADWISWGGRYEDELPVPGIYGRSYNHFHDPTKLLNQAGFSDWLHLEIINNVLPLHAGISSVIWALDSNAQSSVPLFGDYSWPAARNYFYNALTATDVDTRNNNFSDCFRSIGQLMHLIEDVSVPEHTRNEEHATGYNYEVYVQDNLNGPDFNYSMANPVIPYPTILAQPGFSQFSGIPISRLIDTGNFIATGGQNPAATTGTNIGLAEFTNVNFFGTRSTKSYYFPGAAETFQSYSGLNPAGTKQKLYYKKTGDGVPVEHLAAKAYLGDLFTKYHIQDSYDGWILLDDNCYKDYANILLPRAEGYAFSLMQYFFRGDIDAGDATTINGSIDDDEYITGIKMKGVRNNTKMAGNPEDMGDLENGVNVRSNDKLSISYKYANGTIFGNSSTVAFSSYTSTYKFTGLKVPVDATDAKYMLVYSGKLGNEDDAVAAKSFDISPPGDVYYSYMYYYDCNDNAGDGNAYNDPVTANLHWVTGRRDAKTGFVVWEQETTHTESVTGEAQDQCGVAGVCVYKDNVYTLGNRTYNENPYTSIVSVSDSVLECYDKNTGNLKWTQVLTTAYYPATLNYTTYTDIKSGNDGIYVTSFEGNADGSSCQIHLTKLDENGSSIWDYQNNVSTEALTASVGVVDEHVYLAIGFFDSTANILYQFSTSGSLIFDSRSRAKSNGNYFSAAKPSISRFCCCLGRQCFCGGSRHLFI